VTDHQRKLNCLAAMAQAMPNKEPIGGEGLAFYAKLLEPYTPEQVAEAAQRLATRQRWFPAPADFIETIRRTERERHMRRFGARMEATYPTRPQIAPPTTPRAALEAW